MARQGDSAFVPLHLRDEVPSPAFYRYATEDSAPLIADQIPFSDRAQMLFDDLPCNVASEYMTLLDAFRLNLLGKEKPFAKKALLVNTNSAKRVFELDPNSKNAYAELCSQIARALQVRTVQIFDKKGSSVEDYTRSQLCQTPYHTHWKVSTSGTLSPRSFETYTAAAACTKKKKQQPKRHSDSELHSFTDRFYDRMSDSLTDQICGREDQQLSVEEQRRRAKFYSCPNNVFSLVSKNLYSPQLYQNCDGGMAGFMHKRGIVYPAALHREMSVGVASCADNVHRHITVTVSRKRAFPKRVSIRQWIRECISKCAIYRWIKKRKACAEKRRFSKRCYSSASDYSSSSCGSSSSSSSDESESCEGSSSSSSSDDEFSRKIRYLQSSRRRCPPSAAASAPSHHQTVSLSIGAEKKAKKNWNCHQQKSSSQKKIRFVDSDGEEDEQQSGSDDDDKPLVSAEPISCQASSSGKMVGSLLPNVGFGALDSFSLSELEDGCCSIDDDPDSMPESTQSRELKTLLSGKSTSNCVQGEVGKKLSPSSASPPLSDTKFLQLLSENMVAFPGNLEPDHEYVLISKKSRDDKKFAHPPSVEDALIKLLKEFLERRIIDLESATKVEENKLRMVSLNEKTKYHTTLDKTKMFVSLSSNSTVAIERGFVFELPGGVRITTWAFF